MKVSALIAWLTTDFTPDEDILIAVWRRDLFTTPTDQPDTDDEQPDTELWADAVDIIEQRGWGDYLDTQLFDTIQETLDDTHRNNTNKEKPE
jgi:hypothetical protein